MSAGNVAARETRKENSEKEGQPKATNAVRTSDLRAQTKRKYALVRPTGTAYRYVRT